MKPTRALTLAVCTLALVYSCGKSQQPAPDPTDPIVYITKPEAQAQNDNKSGGVYKGVIIGSSGVVRITLQGNTVAAEVSIDGVTKLLQPQNLPAGWISGQAITNVTFSGDGWSLVFTVSANGLNPQISSVSIPGHTKIAVYVVKENSETLVKAYEGTFSYGDRNSQAGTWNFVVGQKDSVFGISRLPADSIHTLSGHVYQQFDSLYIFSESYGRMDATGKLKNNEYTGTWNKTHGAAVTNGTWKAKRTL